MASRSRSLTARPRTAIALLAGTAVVLAATSSPTRIAPERTSASGALGVRVGWALRAVRVRLDGRDMTARVRREGRRLRVVGGDLGEGRHTARVTADSVLPFGGRTTAAGSSSSMSPRPASGPSSHVAPSARSGSTSAGAPSPRPPCARRAPAGSAPALSPDATAATDSPSACGKARTSSAWRSATRRATPPVRRGASCATPARRASRSPAWTGPWRPRSRRCGHSSRARTTRRRSSRWAAELATIPAGAGNPLGTRWIGTSRAAIGIHGTYAEGSIGTAASHGCIRMRIADAEDLFRQVRVGTPIKIHA